MGEGRQGGEALRRQRELAEQTEQARRVRALTQRCEAGEAHLEVYGVEHGVVIYVFDVSVPTPYRSSGHHLRSTLRITRCDRTGQSYERSAPG